MLTLTPKRSDSAVWTVRLVQSGTSHFSNSIFGRLVPIDGKRRWEEV